MLLSISQLQQNLTDGFTFILGDFLIVHHNVAGAYFKFLQFFGSEGKNGCKQHASFMLFSYAMYSWLQFR
jgi:hypothetical protein